MNGKLIDPLTEKAAIEIVPGKKYLMVVLVPRGASKEKLVAIQNSTPIYDAYFKHQGIDMTLMVTDEPLQIYELEGTCPASLNV